MAGRSGARRQILPLALVLSAGGMLSCPLQSLLPPELPAPTQVNEVRWLDQGWTDAERFGFHHISQGTVTFPIPYEWFVALEQPRLSLFESPLLIDPAYIERFGFISSPDTVPRDPGTRAAYGFPGTVGPEDATWTDVSNPDGLPVGFARGEDPTDVTTGASLPYDEIGLTCAACHTGQIEYGGVRLLIDGAPAMVDLDKFRKALFLAILYTRYLPGRFDRFADRVLGESRSDDEKRAELWDSLSDTYSRGKAFKDEDTPLGVGDIEEGFARLDALNRIGNQIFHRDLREISAPAFDAKLNRAPLNAPVNFPHIWNTPWFDWVQYDASIMQPMVRNAGQALGVAAEVNFSPGHRLYVSSVRVDAIHRIEQLLAGQHPLEGKQFQGLRAPEWPEEVLGRIGQEDQERVPRGRALYDGLCQKCHLPPVTDAAFWNDRNWKPVNPGGARFLRLRQIPIRIVGTDPKQAEVLITRKVILPSHLAADAAELDCATASQQPSGPKTELPFAHALGIVVQRVTNRWYDDRSIPEATRRTMNGARPNCLQAEPIYKARPLDGIWATAPYLHNGSVPNLYVLLSPSEERPASFSLGSRAFDPGLVGYKPDPLDGASELRTDIDGNRNTGHEFSNEIRPGVIGRLLSHDERLDLIEFLKTL